MLLIVYNDCGDKAFYIDGDDQIFTNFTDAYQAKLEREKNVGLGLILKTNDRGWFQRINKEVNSGNSTADYWKEYDAYDYVQYCIIVIAVCWPIIGVFGLLAAQKESIIFAIIVFLLMKLYKKTEICGFTGFLVYTLYYDTTISRSNKARKIYMGYALMANSKELRNSYSWSSGVFYYCSLMLFVCLGLQQFANSILIFALARKKNNRVAIYQEK